MDYKTILLKVEYPLAEIVLNRPDAGNTLNADLAQELHHAALVCEQDAEVRAVLLRGEGKNFCLGGDLNHFAEHITNLPFHMKDLIIFLHSAITRLARMEKPVIAAVHGNVAGAGISFMSAADMAIAAQSTTFTLSYTRVGLSPDGASTFFLPRLVGTRRALEMALTNRTLNADEALEWGLVNRLAADDELVERARKWVSELATGPTGAFGAAKTLLRASLKETLESQMEKEAGYIAAMAGSSDFQEGVMAFLQKRPPKFTGK